MKINEAQLIFRCLEKDPLAQQHLFDYFSKGMMGVCLRYTIDSEEAQDVLQMGFVKVFEKLEMYNQKGSLEGWIRKIMVNTALDNLRKYKKFQLNVDIDNVDYQLESDHETVIEALSAQDLLKVIQQMPLGFKTVFNMYVIEGYSHKEIANKLKISEGTSKSQFSRARVYLQQILIKKEEIY
jgi:RNA polymerase sigma-70 factor (ECF subfamily)